jgi:hypothetical protein
MPLSEIHKKKRFKNYAILAVVLGWCALIFAVSIIRMKEGG